MNRRVVNTDQLTSNVVFRMIAVRPGWVYLVGAGPGAADLITLRGLRVLRAADVVLYDALVSPDLLRVVRNDAKLISVGKRGYCVGSTQQETIHETLISWAQAGRAVCHLKGGDPYVFGRGGEEAEALRAAGIPFEVVPGVTAALGACAAAKIPLTHRAVGSTVVLASGHHDPESAKCTLDWEALARLGNIVFYMASRHRAAIARRLISQGIDPHTPAAIIVNATTPEQSFWVTTLDEVATSLVMPAEMGPSLFLVGECVRRIGGNTSLTLCEHLLEEATV
ncbi:MAG: uroporphyrinogen-III C-methyltransferase [Thermogemmata sp.]|nr:uroporphyrinogen-III C-methyltransferase [Thermogemmata sp.]